jgi:hypothetical protein
MWKMLVLSAFDFRQPVKVEVASDAKPVTQIPITQINMLV